MNKIRKLILNCVAYGWLVGYYCCSVTLLTPCTFAVWLSVLPIEVWHRQQSVRVVVHLTTCFDAVEHCSEEFCWCVLCSQGLTLVSTNNVFYVGYIALMVTHQQTRFGLPFTFSATYIIVL
jgi:hypothetical protein